MYESHQAEVDVQAVAQALLDECIEFESCYDFPDRWICRYCQEANNDKEANVIHDADCVVLKAKDLLTGVQVRSIDS